MNSLVGTPYYIAPEVIDEKYTEKADLWSVGGIMYTILCGEPLFIGDDITEVLDKIKDSKNWTFPNSKIWDKVSDDAKDLIKKLMTFDPSKRLSAKQAL
jgi:calcium-dependent protein kinase